MIQKKVSKSRIEAFFRELLPRIEKTRARSVNEITHELGFTPDQITQWSESKKAWHVVLQIGHSLCEVNAETDGVAKQP